MKKALLIISIFTIINIFAQEKKVKIYPFKSAIIEYKYEAQLSGTHIKYIDDYGYKQVDIIKKEINLGETEKKYETIYIIGNRAYTLNPKDTTIGMSINNYYSYYIKYKNKTGVEINEAIDVASARWEHTKTKQFLGKDCKVWEIGPNIRYTWNSIVLYEEINFMIMMVEKATKIEIDVKIPSEIFEIPSGYKFSSGTASAIGFGNLPLDFNKIKLVKKDNNKTSEEATEEASGNIEIELEFNSADFANAEKYTYYDEKGNVVEIKGYNNYKDFDNTIIKSQEFAFSNKELTIPQYSTVLFKTSDGDYGKMQSTKISKEEFYYQYVIFNKDGIIKEYSENSNNGLDKFFNIKLNTKNYKLIMTPIKKSKLLIIQ